MTTVKVDWDELYPYYFITDGRYFNEEVEISEEDLAFIRQVNSDFFVAQELLRMKIHPDGR